MQFPNTRGNYCYISLNSNTIRVFQVSDSSIFFNASVLRQYSGPTHISYNDNTLYSYVAPTYGGKWWTDVVMEKSDDNSDCLVKFMHPEGPSPFFHWPQTDDICWVEMQSILKVIQPSTTGTGRQYILHEKIQRA
jgi:hypothetical protein